MQQFPDLILASGSPRRRELLGFLEVPFRVAVTDAEESATPPPATIRAALPACPVALFDHPTLRAWRKADAACASIDNGVIIGADTIVELDGQVLNKPRDVDDACAMLARLSGRTHTVYTGLCLLQARGGSIAHEPQLALERSRVTLTALDAARIRAYVETGEPLDKAGSYGIQGLGGRLVERVEGSYTNVVGLPLALLYQLLQASGIQPRIEPVAAYRNWLVSQGKEPLPWPPTLP